MNLTLEEISKAVGGTLEGPGNVKVRGYSIDRRTLNAGELFFAIKGPRFDGHRFLQQVAEKKAAAAVVEQSSVAAFDERSGGHQTPIPTIRVASGVQAPQDLPLEVRAR